MIIAQEMTVPGMQSAVYNGPTIILQVTAYGQEVSGL